MRWLLASLACAGALAAGASPAAAAQPALRGLAIDETLRQAPVLAAALDRARIAAADLPLFVRLVVGRGEVASAGDRASLDARLDLYARRQVPVVIAFADPPLDPAAIEAWRPALRELVEHCRGKVAGYQIGDRLEEAARPAPKDYAFLVKFVAVQARSIDSGVLVFEGAIPPDAVAWQQQLYREDVAAYLDATSLMAAGTGGNRAAEDAAYGELARLMTREDASALIGLSGAALEGDPRTAAGEFLGRHLLRLGDRPSFSSAKGSVEAVSALLTAAAALKDVIAGEIVTLDERSSALALALDGKDVSATLPHRLLYNMTTFATYLVYSPAGAARGRLEVKLHLATAGTPAVRDPAAGTSVRLRDVGRDEEAKVSVARVDLADHAQILDFDYGAREVYALRAEAAERALPTVDEIVFRHQQAEAAQQDLFHNYMAQARVNLHFRPSATDSGYDVSLDNRFYWDAEAAEWEEVSFTMNGTRWGRNRPPFPMLQPEKVLSLPLSLRLNRDYAYHLDGVERLGDHQCYVVRFDPINTGQSLYRGRVWIDAASYLRLKVQAVQTLLAPPVVSNEEIQTFEPAGKVGDKPIYLFSRLESKQIMLLAGRNVLVEKQVVFSGFRLDDPAFEQLRQEARRGDNVMYRDTDEGLRYLVKRGNERVVSDRLTTTAKAFMMGATFDPSYDYPVPLAGLDYLDFDFMNRDLQFALIFGGVVAIGNVQKARIAGSRFDLNVDFFGIALSSNDQVYDGRGERKDERLKSRSSSAGANLGYQFTDFQKVTVSTHVQHDRYTSAPDTAPGFIVPAGGVTMNNGVAYEYRRAGYSFVAGYSRSQRAKWQRWGFGEEYDEAAGSYTKYNVAINKDVFFNAFSKLHLNAAYYGGQRQDRFSMYRFGTFDETRMRGIPSAGVRYAEMALQRAQYSFNLLDLYRLDLFYDHAWGRTAQHAGWTQITGIGTEISLRGPIGTLMKVGVGKGFLPSVYRGSGSWVVELSILKPL